MATSALHPVLASACSGLGLNGQLDHLEGAARFSRDALEGLAANLRTSVEAVEIDGRVIADVVAFGSLARAEATESSDFDYLVVLDGLPEEPRAAMDLLEAVETARTSADVSAGHLNKPGNSGIFGAVVSSLELSASIGLQADTNHTQTRRLLLLEESASVTTPAIHERVVAHLLTRYLHPQVGEIETNRVPRFLLNDVVRYWRTLAVDYQAKVWEQSQPTWGLRYLKLIMSRKLTYAGSVMSLLTCGLGHLATVEDLREQFRMPPLARLAQVHDRLDVPGQEALREALLIANEFVRLSGDPEWRTAVNRVTDRRNVDDLPEFRSARAMARDLQKHLESVFFEDPLLQARSRQFLAF